MTKIYIQMIFKEIESVYHRQVLKYADLAVIYGLKYW